MVKVPVGREEERVAGIPGLPAGGLTPAGPRPPEGGEGPPADEPPAEEAGASAEEMIGPEGNEEVVLTVAGTWPAELPLPEGERELSGSKELPRQV